MIAVRHGSFSRASAEPAGIETASATTTTATAMPTLVISDVIASPVGRKTTSQ
jgi:hypothetical protein